jgi:hypothetical protein
MLLHRQLPRMVIIRFPNLDNERRATAFLLGRFSGKSWANGDWMVPLAALPAMAAVGISFTADEDALIAARLAEHDLAPDTAIPLDEFTAQLRSRHGLLHGKPIAPTPPATRTPNHEHTKSWPPAKS